MTLPIAVVVMAITVAGCLSAPTYTSPIPVSYSEDSSGVTVSGDDFTLHFAGGARFHFPDALMVGGLDILGHDAATPCYYENESGIQIMPSPRISPDGAAPILQNQLQPILRGPAVVQIKLEWRTRLDCSSSHAPGGTSTFTVFRNRRIVRHDTLDEPKATESIGSSQCICPSSEAPMSGFIFSSYWTLKRTAFESSIRLLGAVTPVLDWPSDTAHVPLSCFTGTAGQSYQVLSSWPLQGEIGMTFGSEIHARADLLTLARWKLPVVTSISSAGDLQWNRSYTLSIDHSDCATLLTQANTMTDVKINGSSLTYSDLDGIYGGDLGDGNPPGFPSRDSHVELTGAVPTPFAVWLRFDHAVDAVRATQDGKTGAWYVPQRVDDKAWIIWFPHPLSVSQKIQIDTL